MISNERTGKTKLATLGVQGIYDAKDPSMMSELRPDNREGIPSNTTPEPQNATRETNKEMLLITLI